MDSLSFKTFVWPQNPHTYREEWSREGIYEKNDAGEDVFQGMGLKKGIITGSGAFWGETAFRDFQNLAKLFEESSAGNLEHPVWGIRSVYFTGLELTQEPKENCVSYRFEFRVALENGILPK